MVALKILTHNLRDHHVEPNMKDAWPKGRRRDYAEYLAGSLPDLVLVQECKNVSEHDMEMVKYLEGKLPNYGHCGHGSQGIFFNKSSVELLSISSNKLLFNLQDPGTTYARDVVFAFFQLVAQPDKKFHCCSLHYPHNGKAHEARKRCSERVSGYLAELGDDWPVIFGGDFNSNKSTSVYNRLASMAGVVDVVQIPGTRRPASTFNGFRTSRVHCGTDVDGAKHIDHLFLRNGHRWQLSPSRCEVIMNRRHSNQRQLSDHYGIQCEFELSGAASPLSSPSARSKTQPSGSTVSSDSAAKRPRGITRVWEIAERRNCWNGHGGKNVDLKDDNTNAKIMSVDDARKMCEDKGYAGFTYEPNACRMWRLAAIEGASGFALNKRFEVHILH